MTPKYKIGDLLIELYTKNNKESIVQIVEIEDYCYMYNYIGSDHKDWNNIENIDENLHELLQYRLLTDEDKLRLL